MHRTHPFKLLFVILFFVTLIRAQVVQSTVQSSALATASITGQIKTGETPARGVSVMLNSTDRRPATTGQTNSQQRVTTDADGRYKFANLLAGNYRVTVLSPGYIVFGTTDTVRNGQQVTTKDGEAVERIDFTLTRGGVITGRVTSNTNRPIISEPISLTQINDSGQQVPFNPPDGVNLRTDDRGVYRAYGLPPGKYLVSAGRGNAQGGPPGFGANRTYQRTFHPETTDETQATPISVEAGKEVTEVDIRMTSIETYAAVGRVVEAESGKPLAGVLIGHGQARGGGRGQMQGPQQPGGTDGMSGEEGEFRIEGLARGRYSVYLAQDSQNPMTSEYYSEPTTFEITNTDATGLELKVRRGASINGIVMLDGSSDPSALTNIGVSAVTRGGGGGGGGGFGGAGGGNVVQVGMNGIFRVAGLSPGRVNLSLSDLTNPGPFSGLQIVRIEKDGADLQAGLEVTQGEQVTGVRIVAAYGNSTIRGVVKIEGGTLDAGMRMMVMARRTDAPSGGGGRGGGGTMPAQVDSQGQFQIEKLVAGTYEVSVQIMGGGFGGPGGGGFGGPGGIGIGGGNRGGGGQQTGQPQGQQSGQMTRVNPTTQTVVVGNNATQNVVLTVSTANIPAITFQGGGQPGNRGPQGGQPNNPQRRRP